MCSLNGYGCGDNDDETTERPVNSPSKDIVLCRKCRCKNVDVMLTGQSGYCKMCFLTVTNHKFRATLGKSKIIRHGDSILVDHTGELSSTVLLHLIKSNINISTHKKLIFDTTILYIDDGAIIGETDEDQSVLRHKIAEQTREFGFDCYAVSLSQAIIEQTTLDIRPIECQLVKDESDRELHKILRNLSDDTSRIDLLDRLRRKLLILAAQKLNCNKVFVADFVTDIAIKVLGDVCLGRGSQLSALASFCNTQHIDVKILKPMRDFTRQELVYYSDYYDLHPVKSTMTAVKAQPATSIQALVRDFTIELDSQFIGTVSTVFRTADKLSESNNKDNRDTEYNCVLCNAMLDSRSSSDKVSAIRAIEVSRLVSSKCNDAELPCTKKEKENSICCSSMRLNNQECCNGDSHEHTCKCRQITLEDVQKCLCYGCGLIFRNSDISQALPARLLCAVRHRLAMKSMREEICDFLL